ncbi:MAG: nicotinate (nicotinamide) nucleotide adenylyltransferase [Candidatus Sericytochromatia bacterium]|nr:nicotinate (nicotinamide) nucleotide adenylyltransferase [Candidatus Tanganyikabacteria bacterium]
MAVARAALGASYDEVVFLPVALSPHKLDRPPAAAADRFAMCVLATLAEPRFFVSRFELEKPPPSYSVDTAQHFHAERPDAGFWWAIGADNLRALLTWLRLEDFVRVARFLVVPRGGVSGAALQEAIAGLPAWLRGALDVLDMPVVNVSSTQVRDRVRAGLEPAGLVPDDVARFISRYGLYRATPVWQTGSAQKGAT